MTGTRIIVGDCDECGHEDELYDVLVYDGPDGDDHERWCLQCVLILADPLEESDA